jgi:hypothetical protein
MFEKLLVLKGGRVEEDLHAPEAMGLDAKLCQVGSLGWQKAQATFTLEKSFK